jgi:hypothetical protein
MLSNTIVDETAKNGKPLKIVTGQLIQDEPVDVAAWIRFLREMKISKMFSTLPDKRQSGKLEELSQIPLNLMKQLEKCKLFYNHPELLTNNGLQIGCDGFWLHHYSHPHATHLVF